MSSAIEQAMGERLVKDALDAGYYVSVCDGEATPLRNSQDIFAILAAMWSTEEDCLTFRVHPLHSPAGWVLFVWGNAEDCLADYVDNAAMRTLVRGAEGVAESLR